MATLYPNLWPLQCCQLPFRRAVHPKDALTICLAALRILLRTDELICACALSLISGMAKSIVATDANGVNSPATYELVRQLWIFQSTALQSLAADVQALVARERPNQD